MNRPVICALALSACVAASSCKTLDALSLDTQSAIQFDSPLERDASCAAMLELVAVTNAPGLTMVIDASDLKGYEAALGAAFDHADAEGIDVGPGTPLDDLDGALAYRHSARNGLLRSIGGRNGRLSDADAQDAIVTSMVASIKNGYAENGIRGNEVGILLSKTVERCRADADAL